MIGLEGVHKVFNPGTPDENVVLKDIDFRASEGEFVTVIGSNGAGKTTLFHTISGHYPVDAGLVKVDGRDVTRWPEYRRAALVGRIFQDPLLGTAGNMTLEDNLTIAAEKGFRGLRISLNHRKRAWYRERLAELDLGLEDRLKENVGRFSGGQRQALTLLMVLLSRPRIILLDEHTAALDPRNAARVTALTDRFIGEYGLTALMVTHNMQQAIDHGNRLVMMDRGEIILDVSGDEKQSLTVEDLVRRFHEIRGEGFATDEALLNP